MERFIENNLFVFPMQRVMARSQPDFPDTLLDIIHFKEHAPSSLRVEHEWVGNESSSQVGDMMPSEDRVYDSRYGMDVERRRAGKYSNRPYLRVLNGGRLLGHDPFCSIAWDGCARALGLIGTACLYFISISRVKRKALVCDSRSIRASTPTHSAIARGVGRGVTERAPGSA